MSASGAVKCFMSVHPLEDPLEGTEEDSAFNHWTLGTMAARNASSAAERILLQNLIGDCSAR